jgi:cytochrome P450
MTARIDILAPEVRDDPYPVYAALRRESPVCQVEPGGMWAISRHDDVVAVLRDPERFSSRGFNKVWQPPWVGYNPLANSMLAMDDPGHGRLRGLVARGFHARAIAGLEASVRSFAETCVANMEGEVELVGELAGPVPAFVIGTLLGLDARLHSQFKRWADDMLSVTPEPLDAAHAERVRTTIGELCGYLKEVVEDRRKRPVGDVVSELVAAEVEGQRLREAEIVEFLVLLLLGGLETTTHLIATAGAFLAERGELWGRLRGEPGLVPAFVEEMLRFDGPSQSLPRITTDDVTVGGVTIPAGSVVLALVGSANRDPARFPEPDQFDLGRGHPGLQFGHGIHYCIGAPLARLEARVALAALLGRARGLERAWERLSYNRTLTVRGPLAVPVRVTPG